MGRRFHFLLLRCPAAQTGVGAAIVGAISYGLLDRFSLPTQRAVIMIVILRSPKNLLVMMPSILSIFFFQRAITRYRFSELSGDRMI